MLHIDQNQFDRLVWSRKLRLMRKIDQWLMTEQPGWPERGSKDRGATLSEIIDLGTETGLRSEMDFSLFARLLVALGDQRAAFLAHPPVVEVLNWEVENQGAKLRQLYILAYPDRDQQTGDQQTGTDG